MTYLLDTDHLSILQRKAGPGVSQSFERDGSVVRTGLCLLRGQPARTSIGSPQLYQPGEKLGV